MIRLFTSALCVLLLWLTSALMTRRTGKGTAAQRTRRGGEVTAWSRMPARARGGLVVHLSSASASPTALALLREMKCLEPDLPLLATYSTSAGAACLRECLGNQVTQAFLPWRLPGAASRFLDQVRPRVLVLVDCQLCPGLLAAARERGVPVIQAPAVPPSDPAGQHSRGSALVLPVRQALLSLEGAVECRQARHTCVWISSPWIPRLPTHPFDPQSWKTAGEATPADGGRGSAWFVSAGGHHLVLRHYRRGGWLGRFVHDLYLGLTAHRSRPMREFVLLQALRASGLRVPTPVAARCHRALGLAYRGDLLLERLLDVVDLATWLATRGRPSGEQWQRVGKAIRRLHVQGVCHADLNARNLLIDPQWQVWIIDFDRSGYRRGTRWKSGNLERLLRSIRKEAHRRPGSAWFEDDWARLLEGYARPGS